MWKYLILIRCIKSIHTRANKLYNGFYYFYLVPPSTSWKDPMVKLERCDGIDLSNIILSEMKNHSFERVSEPHLKELAMISAVLVCFYLPYLCEE